MMIYEFAVYLFPSGLVALETCAVQAVVELYGENGQCAGGNPDPDYVMTMMVDYQTALFDSSKMYLQTCK